MEKNSKIIKLKKRRILNIGVLIFLIIFLYIIIYTVLFFNKPHLSIYEVKRESLSVDSTAEGIIIRDEIVVTTNKAGKVTYYQRDGARIKKNSMVYSINDNNVFNNISTSSEYSMNEQDALMIKKRIASFDKKFNDSEYGIIKEFQEDIIGSIQQMIDLFMMDQLTAYNAEMGYTASTNSIYSNKSGIISYKVDTLDNIQVKDINKHLFNKEDYINTDLRSLALIENGGKVYKLITSDNWKVIAPIDKELYDLLSNMSVVDIRILEDDFYVTVPVDVDRFDDGYYAILNFSNYMIRYKDYRFIEVDFLVNSETGLKIPVTSITEKDFFMIPLYCFTKGGNDNKENGVIVRTVKDDLSDYEYTFKQCEVYYNDGEYAYVDKDDFTYNTYLAIPDSSESEKDVVRISAGDKLRGVYNVNKGFAIFRRIEIIKENEEYCIVKEGTTNGLSIYDHIALDADTAIEEKSIY